MRVSTFKMLSGQIGEGPTSQGEKKKTDEMKAGAVRGTRRSDEASDDPAGSGGATGTGCGAGRREVPAQADSYTVYAFQSARPLHRPSSDVVIATRGSTDGGRLGTGITEAHNPHPLSVRA